MKNKQSLFRQEALDSRLNRNLGVVRINLPLDYKVVGFFSFILLIIICFFLLFAQTAEKILIKGYLDSEQGIVIVHTALDGVIRQSTAIEGKKIKKGDLLFIIATNREKEKNKLLIENLDQRQANLKREYQIKKDQYHAIAKLHEKHFASISFLKEAESTLLEIANQIKLVDLERIKYKQNQYQLIKSPTTGVITNIFYKQGQMVEATKTLLHIIPDSSKLIAKLYIPSADIGFLKRGDWVSIRYDAYPFQKFGAYKALIKEVNLTVLTDNQEEKPIMIGQPYYKVKAELEQSYITSYGKKLGLSLGMTLTAVKSGDKKRIWEWILDPIYSYYGDTL